METFSALLAICAGISPVTGEFLAQRPVTRSFDVFFAWINDWVNNHAAGDLRRDCAHYDVTVMNRDRDKIPTNTQSNVKFHIKTENFFNIKMA